MERVSSYAITHTYLIKQNNIASAVGMKTVGNDWKNPLPFLFSYFSSPKKNRNVWSENGNDINNIGISEIGWSEQNLPIFSQKSKIHVENIGVWQSHI